MATELSQLLPPPEAVKILIVLVLSFLIGLEREEHKAGGDYSFGGVRTFPIIGLVGYAVALLSRDQLDRKSTRLNSSHLPTSRMPSSA